MLSTRAVDALVNAALAAQRAGSIAELLAQRPLLARWLRTRYLEPVLGTAGDAWPPAAATTTALAQFLRWSVFQLRPDREQQGETIHTSDWTERTSWRPFLALACHHNFLAVPEFPSRYHRRADETAADNLCGIWAVGPSTFYRYLDKGKRQLVDLLCQPVLGIRRLSLRQWVHRELQRGDRAAEDRPARQWHHAQALSALARRDPCSALWHLLHSGHPEEFVDTLQRFRIELARDSETDELVARLAQTELSDRQRCALLRWQSELHAIRNQEERTRRTLEQGLRIATASNDRFMTGILLGALGKFHELRDTDRALACFHDSADFLRRASEDPSAAEQVDVVTEYVAALQRLAWHYVLRNDPRSRAVLERADRCREDVAVGAEANALVDQAWGEYWRRAGNLQLAIEHHHRVLNNFERLGDMRQMLSSYNNLALIYVEGRQFDRAIEYGRRIVDLAANTPADPNVLGSAFCNLGIAYFWQERYEQAIAHYQRCLEIGLQANLKVLVHRAHFNLAEAYFTRYKVSRQAEDERLGDSHAAAVRAAAPTEIDSFLPEAARKLKETILGPEDGFVLTRLLPEETAAHADEMSMIHHHRAALAVPDRPESHIRAHLAIANAYLAISTKEREAAVALIRQHGLGDEFDSEIDALQMTFSRELTKEKVLQAQWKQKSYGVLTEERAHSVLKQVLDAGSINKSGYATLCQVGLATASKHLGTLAERGLLVQMGKGPSTRYVLPAN